MASLLEISSRFINKKFVNFVNVSLLKRIKQNVIPFAKGWLCLLIAFCSVVQQKKTHECHQWILPISLSFPLRKGVVCFRSNLNHLQPGKFCAVEIGPRVLKNIFWYLQWHLRYLTSIYHWKKAWRFISTNMTSFHQECFVPIKFCWICQVLL